MAIFHFHVQILGRGPGRRTQSGAMKKQRDNVIAAAAYRSGQRLTDSSGDRSRTEDYSNRRGVAHTEIMAPEGSASWLQNREQLWNAVEKMEKRKDAQLAREMDIALPHELNHEQRIDLVREFVRTHFVSRGMVADFALHNPVEDKGDDRRNFHAHIMLTLRRATKDGLDPVKTREWNARENVAIWREAWQLHANRALERHGHQARIDHRTLQDQARDAIASGDRRQAAVLDREPEIHVGPRPRAMQQRDVTPESKVRETGAPRTALTRAEKALARQVQRDKERKLRYDARREAWRAELESRRERKEEAYQEWLQARREENEKEYARKRRWLEQDRATRRYLKDKPVQPRTLTPSEAARVKQQRRKQAIARARGEQPTRRIRNYPATDRGPRIGKLWDILTGNNLKAKQEIARVDAASARFMKWMDYWDRKATWIIEGKIGGPGFRRERMLASRQNRESQASLVAQIAHAQKRSAQMKALTTELRGIAAVLMGRQEQGLQRRRQIEGWARPADRARNAPEREFPRGRTRK
ncbi:MobQ family relaxase [Aestuariivirga litoralis]|uniref:MobQ family relaxase n=1 Tax=Aestuariivirga litoralis TaxID=2650924 RepID=UPI0018C4C701|nr:hypothetical protein [Aestuariivirga litoralis]